MIDLTQKESPFSPGKPVSPDLFAGREEEIKLLRRKLQQASFGHNENVFVVGERGMGKSSLAGFVKELAAKEYGFFGVHCHLGGVKDITGFARSVFQEMVRSATDQKVLSDLKELFKSHIRGVSVAGWGVEFTDRASDLQGLADNFIPAILEVQNRIKDRHKGILLIIDDLNGISSHPQFAHYIKSFVDGFEPAGHKIPLLMLFAGLPERRIDMVRIQPSVGRIFDLVELKPLSNESSTKFVQRAFESRGMVELKANELISAFSLIGELSQGYPMLIHELGDAIYWHVTENVITPINVLDGWKMAIANIGAKYLEPDILDSIKSDKYRNILKAIANRQGGVFSEFTKTDLKEYLDNSDIKVFNNFISKVKKAGLIRHLGPGKYEFANGFYSAYINMRFATPEPEKIS